MIFMISTDMFDIISNLLFVFGYQVGTFKNYFDKTLLTFHKRVDRYIIMRSDEECICKTNVAVYICIASI